MESSTSTSSGARPGLLLRSLRIGLFVGAAAYLVALVGLAAIRIPYPFELEWMEGGCVDAVRRTLSGRTIYPEPSLEFIPFLYTPLYFWLCAPIAAATGVGYLPLRLFSFASSLACMVAIFCLVRRETGSSYAGALGAFLFAAMFELTGFWFDVSRADTLFLFILLIAVYLLRFRAATPKGLTLAGVVLFLSFFTKQTALFVSVPLVTWAVLVHGRRALWFAVTFGVLTVVSTLVMEWATDGWYLYYIIETPSTHPVWERFSRHFWLEDMGRPLLVAIAIGLAFLFVGGTRWIGSVARDLFLPAALGAVVFAVASAAGLGLEKAGGAGVAGGIAYLLFLRRGPTELSRDAQARAFWAFVFAGLVLGGWYVRRRTGSFNNIVIPTYGGVAVMFGLGMARLLAVTRPRPVAQGVVLVAALFQFVHLRYDPRDQVPSERQRATYEALVARLAELDGEVFVPAHPWLPTLAGKESAAHRLAIDDCYTDNVERELTSSIRDRRWSAVVLDRRWRHIEDLLAEHYVDKGPLLDAPLRPMTGLFARKPPTLYVPRGSETP